MAKIYLTEKSRDALEVFQIYKGEGEYFDLSQLPPYRQGFSFGGEIAMRAVTASAQTDALAATDAGMAGTGSAVSAKYLCSAPSAPQFEEAPSTSGSKLCRSGPDAKMRRIAAVKIDCGISKKTGWQKNPSLRNKQFRRPGFSLSAGKSVAKNDQRFLSGRKGCNKQRKTAVFRFAG